MLVCDVGHFGLSFSGSTSLFEVFSVLRIIADGCESRVTCLVLRMRLRSDKVKVASERRGGSSVNIATE